MYNRFTWGGHTVPLDHARRFFLSLVFNVYTKDECVQLAYTCSVQTAVLALGCLAFTGVIVMTGSRLSLAVLPVFA